MSDTAALSPFRSVEPASGRLVRAWAPASGSEIEAALAASQLGFESWRQLPNVARAERFLAVARLLRSRIAHIASLITSEMGKPITEARAEVEKSAWACEYFAAEAHGWLADEDLDTGCSSTRVTREPLGVLLAIMPWNFPIWQTFRLAAPSMMAGNVVLLKPAPATAGCGLAIADAFRDAGFPDGALQCLLATEPDVERVIGDRRIAGVTLTGSVRAGRAIGAAAGRAIKPCVLELGGSDPFVVLASADIERAALDGATARMLNTGQSCIAPKRFLVEDSVHDAFVSRLLDAVRALPIGDPMDERTRVGPMARPDLLQALADQVDRSVAMGARRLLGGRRLDGPGSWFAPAVLDAVTPIMPVFREETFGPVAAVMRVQSAEQACKVANDSEFGLGASIYGEEAAAIAIAKRIRAGHVSINTFVRSDPRIPFGGFRDSGVGRELGREGVLAFTATRTIQIA